MITAGLFHGFPRAAYSSVLLLISLALSYSPGAGQAVLESWDVAGPYPADQVAREGYPNFNALFMAPWTEVSAEEDGMVDLNGAVERSSGAGDLVLARRSFLVAQDEVLQLDLEYAQDVDLFFNGWRVFSGRRPHLLGGSGSLEAEAKPDRIPLFAKAGMNEIFLMVASDSDNLAFRIQLHGEVEAIPSDGDSWEELWTTPDTFLTPESVVIDPNRDLLYVTSFDNRFGTKPDPSGYISTLGLDGRILDHKWVEGLRAPTGMDIWKDTLYVAEREHLLALDLKTGEVAGRWAIPDPVFPNDVVIDEEGTVYISDTRTGDWADSRIYRFKDGVFDIFANEGISRANGLWIHEGWLIVGSSGDGLLKRVELSSGRIENIVSFGAGIIDGIRVDSHGNYLVSRWEGQLYRISPEGEVVELLDALPLGWNTADFEYLPEEKLLLFPTFLDNRVRAIRLGG